MKPLAALAAVVAASLCMTGAPPAPRLSRAAISAVEKNIDRRLESLSLDTPLMLLGMTRGIYLDGYGAVFTAEVNLVAAAGASPFRAAITKEEIAKIHQKKLERLPALRGVMREMLVAAAGSLDAVPADERLVLGVSLFHFSWEDSSGLPSQIVMQAPRKALLEFQTSRRDRAALESAVQVREF